MLTSRPDEVVAPGDGAGHHRRATRHASREEKELLQDAAVIGRVVLARRARPRALDARGAAALARAEGVREPGAAELGRRRGRVRVPPRARARRRLRADPEGRAGGEAPSQRRSGSSRSGRPEDHAEMLAHHYASLPSTTRARPARTSRRSRNGRADRVARRGDRAFALNAFAGREPLLRARARALAGRRRRGPSCSSGSRDVPRSPGTRGGRARSRPRDAAARGGRSRAGGGGGRAPRRGSLVPRRAREACDRTSSARRRSSRSSRIAGEGTGAQPGLALPDACGRERGGDCGRRGGARHGRRRSGSTELRPARSSTSARPERSMGDDEAGLEDLERALEIAHAADSARSRSRARQQPRARSVWALRRPPPRTSAHRGGGRLRRALGSGEPLATHARNVCSGCCAPTGPLGRGAPDADEFLAAAKRQRALPRGGTRLRTRRNSPRTGRRRGRARRRRREIVPLARSARRSAAAWSLALGVRAAARRSRRHPTRHGSCARRARSRGERSAAGRSSSSHLVADGARLRRRARDDRSSAASRLRSGRTRRAHSCGRLRPGRRRSSTRSGDAEPRPMARLRAARATRGRAAARAEADEQLERALAFYRSRRRDALRPRGGGAPRRARSEVPA